MVRRNGLPTHVWRHGDEAGATGASGALCFVNTAHGWTMAADGYAPIVVERFDALLSDGKTAASATLFTGASGVWVQLPKS